MPAGSQVSLAYDIDLSLTQIPENLIFYSDSARTNAIYKENGTIHFDGYFSQDAQNKTESKTLYWEWPMETGSTQNQIDANDLLDSNWMGDRIVLGIEAKGRQVVEENATQYAVTFDANGGTLQGYGNAGAATKMVTYGEAYGDLPTPTREGYTFKGWNGKNKLNLVDFVDDTEYVTITENKIIIRKADVQNRYIKASRNFQLVNNNTYTVSAKLEGEFTGRIYGFFGQSLFDYYSNGKFTFRYSSSDDKGRLYIIQNTEASTNLSLQSNILEITNIQVEEGTQATTYEPYFLTSITPVTQNKNHTLTAIWEEN